MLRGALSAVVASVITVSVGAQQPDPVAQALAQGDAYQAKKDFEKALEAYQKADKLSHHGSAIAYLKIGSIERKAGEFLSALDDAKRAVKAAGDNKPLAIQAHLFRASLLMQMSGKPTDKKLKEAEEETRQALALDAEHPLSHYSLGVVLIRQERDAEGVAELNRFIAMPAADRVPVAEARRFIASPIRVREPFAPDFSFTTLERESISNAGLRGKVVLLDFWGTWCPPCRESVPILRDLNKKYTGKPFQLIGISSDQDEDVWRAFIEKQRMSWSEYIDLSGAVQEAFQVDSYPTYIVLDKDGVIRFRQSGLSNFTGGDLEDVINKAIKRASDPALAAAAAPEKPHAETAPSSPQEGNSSSSTPETPLSDVEVWSISGNVYKNDALGFSYQLPKGWTAASPESIHAVNQRMAAAAQTAFAQQHPDGPVVRMLVPTTILYASLRGGGDAQRMTIPCLRISATRVVPGGLTLERFGEMAQRMAQSAGAKVLKPPSEFLVHDQQFMRVDLEHASASSRFYRAYVQTHTDSYTVTIEFFATSPDELERETASLQSVSFRGEQE